MEMLYRTADEIIEEYGGRHLQSPAIGHLSAWKDVPTGLNFVNDIQARLLALEWPATLILRPEACEAHDDAGNLLFRGPRVRMGVHTGHIEVQPDAEGNDVASGAAIYQLARVTHALHGGQIALTESACLGLGDDVQSLRDLGSHRLNGVLGVGRLRQYVLPNRANYAFPPLLTQTELKTNALARPSVFVGRDGDLRALRELAGFGVRLVTIVGPEGSGKSRLCRQFALLNREHYARDGGGGVWRCDVNGSSGGDLVRAVGNALGIPMILGRTIDAVLTQMGYVLAARGKILIILDEIGEDTSEIARAVARWLEMAPAARFMVGAPHRLGISGEVAYELAPLPEVDRANARNADSVRLFNLRARRASPRFQADDPALIADLVGSLDRNPLAIEIAAGLMHAWSPSDLLFALRGKTGPAVHRVLEAAWEQLDEDECRVLSHCAVYPGGFDRFGVDAVVGDDHELDSAAILRTLHRRGLIASGADAHAPEVLRYVLGRWVRRFALAQLTAEEREPLYVRLADRILALCEDWPERAWERDGPEVVARIGIEWFNLIGVIEWGIADQYQSAEALDRAMRALLVLAPVFQTRGPAEIHLKLLDAVLERCDTVLGADPLLQVQVLAARANTWRMTARLQAARADLERGLRISEKWSDVYGRALCANTSGLLCWDAGEPDEAIEQLGVAADLFQAVGNRLRQGIATGTLGVMRMELGEHGRAEAHLTRAIEIFEEIGARHFEGMYLGNLGLLYRRIEREDEARDLYIVARQIHQDTGDVRLQGIMAMNLGALDFRTGRDAAANGLYKEGLALALEVGDRRTEAACTASLGIVSLDRGDYDKSRRLLMQAMAINRDLGNRRGEATDTGYLGMLHHLQGERGKAADYYRRAVRMTVETGSRRQELIFLAFLGALEAEERQVDDTRAVFEAASRKAADTGEVDLIATVRILALSLKLLEGVISEDKATYATERAVVMARLQHAEEPLGDRRGDQRFAVQIMRNTLDILKI